MHVWQRAKGRKAKYFSCLQIAGILFVVVLLVVVGLLLQSISQADPVPASAGVLWGIGLRFAKGERKLSTSNTTIKIEYPPPCHKIGMPGLQSLRYNISQLLETLKTHQAIEENRSTLQFSREAARIVKLTQPLRDQELNRRRRRWKDATDQILKDFKIAYSLGSGCTPKFTATIRGEKFIVKAPSDSTINPDLLEIWRKSAGLLTERESRAIQHKEVQFHHPFNAYTHHKLRTEHRIETMKERAKRDKLKISERAHLLYPALYFPRHFGNEEVAYAFDRLIEFNRTPPAVVLPLRTSFVLKAISEQSLEVAANLFRHCRVNYSSYVAELEEEHGDQFIFTSLIKYNADVQESPLASVAVNVEKWTSEWSAGLRVRGRERAMRCLFDYIVGNHDRGVNQFWAYSDMVEGGRGTEGGVKNGSSQRILIYLDQNALFFDYGAGWQAERKVALRELDMMKLRMSTSCKFYEQPVRRLRELLQERKLTVELSRIFKKLNHHVNPLLVMHNTTMEEMMKGVPLLNTIRRRALDAIKVVDKCIDDWGYDFVFCEE